MNYLMPDYVHDRLIQRIGQFWDQNPNGASLLMDMLRDACRLGAAHELREMSERFRMKDLGILSETYFKLSGDALDKRADELDPLHRSRVKNESANGDGNVSVGVEDLGDNPLPEESA